MWGLCYQDFNRMERLEKTVVPVEILYSWWVDGEVPRTSIWVHLLRWMSSVQAVA